MRVTTMRTGNSSRSVSSRTQRGRSGQEGFWRVPGVPWRPRAFVSGTDLSLAPGARRADPTPRPRVRGASPPPAGTGALSGRRHCVRSRVFTVLKDPLHVEAVRGARLVVGAALQVAGELPRSGVVDDAWVGGADGVCNTQRQKGDTVTTGSPNSAPRSETAPNLHLTCGDRIPLHLDFAEQSTPSNHLRTTTIMASRNLFRRILLLEWKQETAQKDRKEGEELNVAPEEKILNRETPHGHCG